MTDLDFGIIPNTNESQETEDIMIHNPFFNKKLESDLEELDQQEVDITYLCRNYKRLLVLCLLGKQPVSKNIYNKKIGIQDLDSNKTKLVLTESNIKVLKNIIHFNNVIQVSSTYLEMFNHFDLDLDETELVLPILNINFKDLGSYLKIYDGPYHLDDLFKVKLLEEYFNSPERNTVLSTNYSNMISNLTESKYWTFYYNCLLNLTVPFLKRGFQFELVRVNEINVNTNTAGIKCLNENIDFIF